MVNSNYIFCKLISNHRFFCHGPMFCFIAGMALYCPVANFYTIPRGPQTSPNIHVTRKPSHVCQLMCDSSSRRGITSLCTRYPVMEPLTRVRCSHSPTGPMGGILPSIQNGDCTSLLSCKRNVQGWHLSV